MAGVIYEMLYAMSSFTFNFLADDDGGNSQQSPGSGGDGGHEEQNANLQQQQVSMKPNLEQFSWIEDLDSSYYLNSLQKSDTMIYDLIPISSDLSLKAVRGEAKSKTPTEYYRKTDLVPGVYEGGLKVWECSIDLCRHLVTKNVVLEGNVLELGCGHGLPGCLALKQAYSKSRSCSNTKVCFSDYNEFVLRDVTSINIPLNLAKMTTSNTTSSYSSNDDDDNSDLRDLADWISKHTLVGAGDWNAMSKELVEEKECTSSNSILPNDGKFDFVLAAETTYSKSAAYDTADLIMKHLKPEIGVAYIATKRYYFGVGGGSDALRDRINTQPSSGNDKPTFKVEILEVYDDGSSNIREVLKITSTST